MEVKKPFGPHDNGWAIIKIGKGIKSPLSEERNVSLYQLLFVSVNDMSFLYGLSAL